MNNMVIEFQNHENPNMVLSAALAELLVDLKIVEIQKRENDWVVYFE